MLTFSLLVFATMVANSQTAVNIETSKVASKDMKCNPSNCTPAMCDAMVAAGKCTPEQAAKCKATCASTKVASAKLVREETNTVELSSQAEVKTKSCAKSCAKMKAKAGKKSTL